MIAMPCKAYADAVFMGGGLNDKYKLFQNIVNVVSSQIINTTHKPTGLDVSSEDTWGASKNAEKYVTGIHLTLPAGTIAITAVGETHRLVQDIATANSLIQNHGGADLIFYERGLSTGYGGSYPRPQAGGQMVTEEQLTTSHGISWGLNNFGVSPAPRDMVTAGYLVLCAASGDQNSAVKIILLCGENHVGVLHYFNEIASRSAPWLLKRRRKLHFVKSHTTAKENKWGQAIR